MPELHVQAASELRDEYDLVIAALGYERRARFICEDRLPKVSKKFAVAFEDGHVLSFDDNESWFRTNGFDTPTVNDREFRTWADTLVGDLPGTVSKESSAIRVLIDVSSQSRVRIAALIAALADLGCNRSVEVDVAYAIASFEPPPDESSEISVAEPVLGKFAGWSAEPDLPIAVIIGTGYERDRAIGVLEYLEATEVWTWVPVGPDDRYRHEVLQANSDLWDRVQPSRVINYDVQSPFETFLQLESLCYGIMDRVRPVLVPFGPKIFAVTALLASLHWGDKIAVWRVSGEHREEPVDRRADGNVVILRAVFSPTERTTSDGDQAALAVIS